MDTGKLRDRRLRKLADARARRVILYAIMRSGEGLSFGQAIRVWKALQETVADTLKKGGLVNVRGFGTFYVSRNPARIVRNPRTGVRMKTKAYKVPAFRFNRDFAAAVADAPEGGPK